MSETCRYPDSDKPPRASGYGQHFKNHIYQNSAHKKQPYLAVIHRLDQPVEGLLVFAKTPAAAKELNRQLQSLASANIIRRFFSDAHRLLTEF